MEATTNKNIADKIIFAAINNIPPDYHSADLRNYFSQFIETRGFDIFHFRHRPELKKSNENQEQKCHPDSKPALCCVVKLKQSKFSELQKMYHRKHWLDSNGESIPRLCFISKIRVNSDDDKSDAYKTRAEQKQIPEDREKFTETDLMKLPELHPPDVMPNGNVGTPTMEFLKLIRECRLPPVVIKKLGLSFPKTRTNKKYGNVSFDYGGDTYSGSNEEEEFEVRSGSGHKICDAMDNVIDLDSAGKDVNLESGNINSDSDNQKGIDRKWRKDPKTKQLMREKIEERMIQKDNSDSEEDNDSCEEWERHEAFCDDPSNQERNKERLFEEEIELKWEKGGSGLVFYTDAQYWQEQEGDFDEQTTDDWDVDMSAYYEEGAGDKDIRDFITMRQEQRRREGIEDTDRFTAKIAIKRANTSKQVNYETKIGKFEKHTKGIGRKILEEQGWKEGLGLGSSSHGISDALESEGQHAKDKTGFGFRGEKLVKHRVKNRNSQRDVIISTVYDDEKQTDPNEPLLRRHNHYTLKYRDKVEFKKADNDSQ